MTMTKRKIAIEVAERANLTQHQAFAAVQATLDVIVDELAGGGHIELRGFGVFEIVTQKSRIGRNPNRPEITVEIPERKVVKFRSGRQLAEKVQKLKV
ncbi:MAG: integration host factor subunit beta [Lentisphaeria bacterium]|jgi:nucleoid DNA-binding protein|nr:integration host factor subunit beta [Lentisphaeria bacterium]